MAEPVTGLSKRRPPSLAEKKINNYIYIYIYIYIFIMSMQLKYDCTGCTGQAKKFLMTWGLGVVFAGYFGFLHQL